MANHLPARKEYHYAKITSGTPYREWPHRIAAIDISKAGQAPITKTTNLTDLVMFMPDKVMEDLWKLMSIIIYQISFL